MPRLDCLVGLQAALLEDGWLYAGESLGILVMGTPILYPRLFNVLPFTVPSVCGNSEGTYQISCHTSR